MRLLLLGAGGQLGQELEGLCSKSRIDVVALRRRRPTWQYLARRSGTSAPSGSSDRTCDRVTEESWLTNSASRLACILVIRTITIGDSLVRLLMTNSA